MFGGGEEMKINQSKIAEQVGVDKGFVNFVLEGRRNPNTAKGMQVVLAAAEQYAERCMIEYINNVFAKWISPKKKKVVAKKPKLKDTHHETFEQRHSDWIKETIEKRKQIVIKTEVVKGLKGTTWDRNSLKTKAQIYDKEKKVMVHIGYFDTEQEAADAYKQAKLNKENAKTNQPT